MEAKQTLLVTGGAGFIGSHFLEKIACNELVKKKYNFIVLDALTYAANEDFLKKLLSEHNHLRFIHADICNMELIKPYCLQHQINGILHFAAESHVDQSISGPSKFIQTNIVGTHNLLMIAQAISSNQKNFRFLQVSTDEVYGSLKDFEPSFTENHPLMPNSPYSASKASADLLVRSYFETYKLDTVITRCSNNYGIRQHTEKLIPVIIKKAKNNQPIPIYGTGKNIRDWIHVEDHVRGIWSTFLHGRSGEIYNFGGNAELCNIDLAHIILKKLTKPEHLIQFVTDRKGHDWRYAINYSKAEQELNWRPEKKIWDSIDELISFY